MTTNGVYLIHLDTPLKHATHYVGWSKDIDTRVAHHRNNTGCRFLRAANIAGITWRVVRIWEGKDGHFERKIHAGGNKKRLCPICNPSNFANHAKE